MSAIPFLLALGLLIAGGFLAAFVWAVRSGQFDDTTTPSLRILADGGSAAAREPISDQMKEGPTVSKDREREGHEGR